MSEIDSHAAATQTWALSEFGWLCRAITRTCTRNPALAGSKTHERSIAPGSFAPAELVGQATENLIDRQFVVLHEGAARNKAARESRVSAIEIAAEIDVVIFHAENPAPGEHPFEAGPCCPAHARFAIGERDAGVVAGQTAQTDINLRGGKSALDVVHPGARSKAEARRCSGKPFYPSIEAVLLDIRRGKKARSRGRAALDIRPIGPSLDAEHPAPPLELAAEVTAENAAAQVVADLRAGITTERNSRREKPIRGDPEVNSDRAQPPPPLTPP
jgi:hypothetical protein